MWSWFPKQASRVGGGSGVEACGEGEARRALELSHQMGQGPVPDALTLQETCRRASRLPGWRGWLTREKSSKQGHAGSPARFRSVRD